MAETRPSIWCSRRRGAAPRPRRPGCLTDYAAGGRHRTPPFSTGCLVFGIVAEVSQNFGRARQTDEFCDTLSSFRQLGLTFRHANRDLVVIAPAVPLCANLE